MINTHRFREDLLEINGLKFVQQVTGDGPDRVVPLEELLLQNSDTVAFQPFPLANELAQQPCPLQIVANLPAERELSLGIFRDLDFGLLSVDKRKKEKSFVNYKTEPKITDANVEQTTSRMRGGNVMYCTRYKQLVRYVFRFRPWPFLPQFYSEPASRFGLLSKQELFNRFLRVYT